MGYFFEFKLSVQETIIIEQYLYIMYMKTSLGTNGEVNWSNL